MRNNRKSRQDLSAIRSGEVYPSFEEIRELVTAYQPANRALSGAMKPMVEGFMLALLIAGLFWQGRNTPLAPLSHIIASQSSDGFNQQPLTELVTELSSSASSSVSRGGASRARSRIVIAHPIASSNNPSTLPSQGRPSSIPNEQRAPIIASQSIQATITHEVVSNSKAPIAPLPTMANESENQWAGFAAGGLAVSSAAIPISQSLSGSLGIRYNVSKNSSLVMELRRSSFAVSHTQRSTVFHDSAISLDGNTYLNSFGSTSNVMSTDANIVGSLEAGFRFELLASSDWSPFGELLLGGSTSGVVTSGLLGLRYTTRMPFSFDMGARADQLIAPKASPVRALELEFGFSYRW